MTNDVEYDEYVEKPERIKAFMWDGTVEGAVALRAFLDVNGCRHLFQMRVDFHNRGDRPGKDTYEPYVFILMNPESDRHEWRLRPLSWVLIKNGNFVDTYGFEQEYMDAHYTKVEK